MKWKVQVSIYGFANISKASYGVFITRKDVSIMSLEHLLGRGMRVREEY